MGLMVQFIYLVLKGFAILLVVKESAGSSIAPAPSQVIFGSIFPTKEDSLHPGPPWMRPRRTAGSPVFQPNVPPLKLATAVKSTKFLAPARNVQSIVPSLSSSTGYWKPPHVEGGKLASEAPVSAESPPFYSPIERLPDQPTLHRIAPSNSPVPSASPPKKFPSYSAPVHLLLPEFPPSNFPGPGILKGDGKPISSPSHGTPKKVSPLDTPTKAPVQAFPEGSSSVLRALLKKGSSPASADKGINWKKNGIAGAVPPNGSPKKLLPQGHTTEKAPMQNSRSDSAKASSHSVIKSPPHKRFQPTTPLPSIPYYKHRQNKKNSSTPTPFSVVPPASKNIVMAAPPPSFPPKVYPNSRHKSNAPPTLNAVAPSDSPFASAESPLSPISPPRVSTSQQMTIPPFPPWNSPPSSSSKNPKVPLLPHIQAVPPPPLNEDCESLSCREPFTNNPYASPCGCVLAMQVGLRLDLPLYAFFPLVSDLAAQISRGISMKQSQVRIMGANADSQNQEKTVVLLDLVPFGAKFDNSTAHLIYQKFYQKEVAIEPYYFGNYEVLYLRYPGLPASPPAPSTFDSEAYSGQGSKRRPLKPLGVDVSRQQHKKGLKRSVIAIIVLLASLSLTLCCAVAWVLLFRHRRRDAQPELNPTIPMPSLAKSPGFAASKIGSGLTSISPSYKFGLSPYTGTAKTFNAVDIERATDSFDASRIIGEGGFGIVYSGVLNDGTKVAVKVLKRDNQQGGREFLAEVEMLSRLHHRNLVKLVGICMEEHAHCLVYELISNGSVESHLHGVDKADAPLDWNARLKVALGAARGLAYLHEDSSPRVIHRDFKSSNILLEYDFTPKVSDFGLARTGSDEENKHISTRVMGTFGYVAPEYAMTGHLLIKSDVYSYGVVLLELLTGRKPVDMSRPPGQENLVTWARPLLTSKEGLELMLDQSLRPDFSSESFAKVAAIASMCVQPEVSDRPFMSEVVQALKLICNDIYTANNFGSRICSPEHISSYFDARPNATSSYMPYHMESPFSDVEWGLRASEVFSASARFERMDSMSFRRHSSPYPLKSRRVLPLLSRIRGWSQGSTSEQRAILGLWSRSH